jgi:mono/diheme cytochrome c family protein
VGWKPQWRAGIAVILALAALLPGCSTSSGPQFPLNTEGREPGSVKPEQAQAVRQMLEQLFGTPNQPRVPDGVHLDPALLAVAAGPVRGDEQGNEGGLYRKLCVTCHGLAGDGAGPAAATLDPYPRDFRNGTFKYTSTLAGARPTSDDLRRVLLQGVPGTAMPSQIRLRPEQLDALVEYVKYLSLRGQSELYVMQLVVDEDAFLPLSPTEVLEEGVRPATELWAKAGGQVLKPTAPPPLTTPEQRAASVARDRTLYEKKEAQCTKCHGPAGRGDGEQKDELYDDWNKRKLGLTPAETAALARRFTLPIQRLRARDFRQGVFRGGSSPKDLYLRIHIGIKGTPMPAAGPAPGAAGILTPTEIWDVVNYVRELAGGYDR